MANDGWFKCEDCGYAVKAKVPDYVQQLSSPCPHCGGTVLAKERVLEASRFGPAVIRRAECSNASCGWVYMRTGGMREEFVRAVNERSGERG